MDGAGGTAEAAAQLERKEQRRARWAKIGSGLVGVAVLVKLAAVFLRPAEVMACDDGNAQTALTELMNEELAKQKQTARVASITGAQTVSRDDKVARCSAHVALTDRENGTLTYHLDTKKVFIDKIE